MTHPIHPCEIRAFSRKSISAIVPGHVTQLGIFSASKRVRNHSRVHLREKYISNGTCKGDNQCAQPHRASQGEKYHCAPTNIRSSASVATPSLLRSSLRSAALLSKSRLTGNSSSSSSSLLLCLLALRLLDASLRHRGLCRSVDSHCGDLVER